MEIITYNNFAKKNNSTLQPSDGTTVTVRLKDDTSIENPTFILASNDFTINYVRAFGRYYYVTNIISRANGLIEIECDMDVLATYKSNILSYTAFVERSASNYDTRINDPAISQAQQFDHFSTLTYSLDNGQGRYSASGCFFVRIANKTGGSVGGITTYVCTSSELTSIMQAALNQENYSDWLTDTLLSIFNPMEFIISIKWFPFSITYMLKQAELASVNRVDYGWFTADIDTHMLLTNVVGCRLDSSEMSFQSTVYGDWRDYNSNFTDTSIYIPGVGIQSLDPIYFKDNIQCSLSIDYLTGEGTYFLYTARGDNNYYISTFDTKVGIDIQVSQLLANVGGAVSDVASSIGNMAAGNIYGTAVGAIEGVKNIFSRTPSIKGNTGNILQFGALGKYVLTRRSVGTGEYPTTVMGKPLMKNVKLSTLSGFVKCGNASISISGYESECDKINAFLNNGFYIE